MARSSSPTSPSELTARIREHALPLAAKILRSGDVESVGVFRKARGRDFILALNIVIAGAKLGEGLRALDASFPSDFCWSTAPPRSVMDALTKMTLTVAVSDRAPRHNQVDARGDDGLAMVATAIPAWHAPDVLKTHGDFVDSLVRTTTAFCYRILVPEVQFLRDVARDVHESYGIQLQAQRYQLKEVVTSEAEPLWWHEEQ